MKFSLPKGVDLTKVKCGWLGSPYTRNDSWWRKSCRFNAHHLIGGVPICNTHFRVMRRYVEAQKP